MEKVEFLDSLPTSTECELCGVSLRVPTWEIALFGAGEWMGFNLVKCVTCDFLKIAAAGSNHEAHRQAQIIRLKLLQSAKR